MARTDLETSSVAASRVMESREVFCSNGRSPSCSNISGDREASMASNGAGAHASTLLNLNVKVLTQPLGAENQWVERGDGVVEFVDYVIRVTARRRGLSSLGRARRRLSTLQQDVNKSSKKQQPLEENEADSAALAISSDAAASEEDREQLSRLRRGSHHSQTSPESMSEREQQRLKESSALARHPSHPVDEDDSEQSASENDNENENDDEGKNVVILEDVVDVDTPFVGENCCVVWNSFDQQASLCLMYACEQGYAASWSALVALQEKAYPHFGFDLFRRCRNSFDADSRVLADVGEDTEYEDHVNGAAFGNSLDAQSGLLADTLDEDRVNQRVGAAESEGGRRNAPIDTEVPLPLAYSTAVLPYAYYIHDKYDHPLGFIEQHALSLSLMEFDHVLNPHLYHDVETVTTLLNMANVDLLEVLLGDETYPLLLHGLRLHPSQLPIGVDTAGVGRGALGGIPSELQQLNIRADLMSTIIKEQRLLYLQNKLLSDNPFTPFSTRMYNLSRRLRNDIICKLLKYSCTLEQARDALMVNPVNVVSTAGLSGTGYGAAAAHGNRTCPPITDLTASIMSVSGASDRFFTGHMMSTGANNTCGYSSNTGCTTSEGASTNTLNNNNSVSNNNTNANCTSGSAAAGGNTTLHAIASLPPRAAEQQVLAHLRFFRSMVALSVSELGRDLVGPIMEKVFENRLLEALSFVAERYAMPAGAANFFHARLSGSAETTAERGAAGVLTASAANNSSNNNNTNSTICGSNMNRCGSGVRSNRAGASAGSALTASDRAGASVTAGGGGVSSHNTNPSHRGTHTVPNFYSAAIEQEMLALLDATLVRLNERQEEQLMNELVREPILSDPVKYNGLITFMVRQLLAVSSPCGAAASAATNNSTNSNLSNNNSHSTANASTNTAKKAGLFLSTSPYRGHHGGLSALNTANPVCATGMAMHEVSGLRNNALLFHVMGLHDDEGSSSIERTPSVEDVKTRNTFQHFIIRHYLFYVVRNEMTPRPPVWPNSGSTAVSPRNAPIVQFSNAFHSVAAGGSAVSSSSGNDTHAAGGFSATAASCADSLAAATALIPFGITPALIRVLDYLLRLANLYNRSALVSMITHPRSVVLHFVRDCCDAVCANRRAVGVEVLCTNARFVKTLLVQLVNHVSEYNEGTQLAFTIPKATLPQEQINSLCRYLTILADPFGAMLNSFHCLGRARCNTLYHSVVFSVLDLLKRFTPKLAQSGNYIGNNKNGNTTNNKTGPYTALNAVLDNDVGANVLPLDNTLFMNDTGTEENVAGSGECAGGFINNIVDIRNYVFYKYAKILPSNYAQQFREALLGEMCARLGEEKSSLNMSISALGSSFLSEMMRSSSKLRFVDEVEAASGGVDGTVVPSLVTSLSPSVVSNVHATEESLARSRNRGKSLLQHGWPSILTVSSSSTSNSNSLTNCTTTIAANGGTNASTSNRNVGINHCNYTNIHSPSRSVGGSSSSSNNVGDVDNTSALHETYSGSSSITEIGSNVSESAATVGGTTTVSGTRGAAASAVKYSSDELDHVMEAVGAPLTLATLPHTVVTTAEAALSGDGESAESVTSTTQTACATHKNVMTSDSDADAAVEPKSETSNKSSTTVATNNSSEPANSSNLVEAVLFSSPISSTSPVVHSNNNSKNKKANLTNGGAGNYSASRRVGAGVTRVKLIRTSVPRTRGQAFSTLTSHLLNSKEFANSNGAATLLSPYAAMPHSAKPIAAGASGMKRTSVSPLPRTTSQKAPHSNEGAGVFADVLAVQETCFGGSGSSVGSNDVSRDTNTNNYNDTNTRTSERSSDASTDLQNNSHAKNDNTTTGSSIALKPLPPKSERPINLPRVFNDLDRNGGVCSRCNDSTSCVYSELIETMPVKANACSYPTLVNYPSAQSTSARVEVAAARTKSLESAASPVTMLDLSALDGQDITVTGCHTHREDDAVTRADSCKAKVMDSTGKSIASDGKDGVVAGRSSNTLSSSDSYVILPKIRRRNNLVKRHKEEVQ